VGLVNGSFPALYNGVSQQPDNQRLPTQGIEQINGISSLMDGLGKRPPTEHVAKVSSSNYAYPYVHYIDRDTLERYVAIIYPDHISVFGQDGTPYPVIATPADLQYLSCPTPNIDIKCLSIADTTFVLNRTKATAMTGSITSSRAYEALIWVRQGNYDCKYTIDVSGLGDVMTPPLIGGSGTYTTSATNPDTIQTTRIAAELANSLVTSVASVLSITLQGNAIWLRRFDGKPFVVSVTDDNGGHNMSLTADTVQHFSDLPQVAPNGFFTKVIGDIESAADDYYVKFQATGNKSFSNGLWVETMAQALKYHLDETTMPHILVRKQDVDGSVTGNVGAIYFQFTAAPWADRAAGDDKSVPVPSFVGQKLNDVFLHRGRLGFLSNGNVILSQANQLYNFWKQSATQLLDSDPIDTPVAQERAVNLRHGVGFNQELILFADHTQFVLSANDVLSPKTVSVKVSTVYASHLDTPPVLAENMLYFPFDNGDFAGMREYFVTGLSQQKDATDITQHCSRYIPGSITKIAVAPVVDMLFCLTDQARNKIWPYRWLLNQNAKVQSSWSQWVFGNNTTIVGIGFLGDAMYLVCVYSDGTYIERLRLDPGHRDDGATYLTHLDRRVNEKSPNVVISYDLNLNQTTIYAPYRMDPADEWVVVTRQTPDPTWIPGRVLTKVSSDTSKITVEGDARAGFWLGRKYTFQYTVGKPQLRSVTPTGGLDNITEGRLQIKDFSIKFNRTGYFRAEVTAQSRDTATYPMTGQRLRVPLGTGLGTVQLLDGVLKFPVMSRNDQFVLNVINDSHLPSFINGAEWVGNYWTRAKRL
jgi:hypothetical protein